MGTFLAVAAFRNVLVEDLATAAVDLLGSYGVPVTVEESGEAGPELAALFSSVEGWSTVLWPTGFVVHDLPIGRELSARLSTLGSVIHVIDTYWVHALYDNGELVDGFCSDPARQVLDGRGPPWTGSAEKVSGVIGVPPENVAPYFQTGARDKAFADDRSPRGSIWVLVDFWRRLGIPYPMVDPDAEADLGISFAVGLPSSRLPVQGP